MVMSKPNLKCGKFDLDKDIKKVVFGIVNSNHNHLLHKCLLFISLAQVIGLWEKVWNLSIHYLS